MVVPEPRRQFQRLGQQLILTAIVVPATSLPGGHDKTVLHRTDTGAIGQRRIEAHFAAVQIPDKEAIATRRRQRSELLAIKRPGQPFVAFPVPEHQLQSMGHYTASVAVHSDLRLVALTAPRGNRFFIWDLDSGEVRLDAPLPDCAGVGAVKDGFVVTSGQGRCRYYDCRQDDLLAKPLDLPAGLWDNHLHLMA